MNWHKRFPPLYHFLKSLFGASPKLRYHATLRKELLSVKADGELYLIGTNTGGNGALLSFDLLLGIGLRARGKKVKYVLCDGALPACQMCEYTSFDETQFPNNGLNSSFCKTCFYPANKLIKQLGFEVIKISDVNPKKFDPLDEAAAFDQHGRAGFLRYEARGDFCNLVKSKRHIYGQYKTASQIAYYAYKKIIEAEQPSCVILHHGVYVPQGSALQAVVESKTRAVTWCTSYRKNSVMLAHGDTYHKTMPAETDRVLRQLNFDRRKENLIRSYLQSRSEGTNDWITFSKRNKTKLDIRRALGIPADADTYALFTNVIWDANIHFDTSIFKDMIDWMLQTIRFFRQLPSKHLIIRVHPAEALGTIKSRQLATVEIIKNIDKLPKNVHVISPTNTALDTYSIIEECDVALVYGTKAAIEIAASGKPVVVSGSAWARGKGFTIDPKTIEEYEEILSKACDQLEMSDDAKLNAIRYAYYVFFERTITISNLKKPRYFAPFVINRDLDDFASIMCDVGLQTALDEIVSGKPASTG